MMVFGWWVVHAVRRHRRDFDLANTADVETGQLGAERASNKEVPDYATMLAQVHTEVRQKGATWRKSWA